MFSNTLDNLKDSSILIVDDQEVNTELLECFLSAEGYTSFNSTTDPRQVLSLYTTQQPDLILLDLHMPHLDGFEVMKELRALISEDTYLPILVLTADITSEAKQKALSGGAKDFLTKPFNESEVLLRIKNLLETRHLHLRLQDQNRTLEERVRERTSDLQESQMETLERLALAAEYRDDDTGQHTQRVGHTSALLAQLLCISADEVDIIRRAAPLHDVGKIGVPDMILLKPGKLTSEEYEIMKTHTVTGAKMLSGSRSLLLQRAEEIALFHHERWDGKGYAGVQGKVIPLAGRIVAVADVFDALSHERPYKKAWPVAEAVAEVQSQSAKQFDPQVVEAFSALPHEELV